MGAPTAIATSTSAAGSTKANGQEVVPQNTTSQEKSKTTTKPEQGKNANLTWGYLAAHMFSTVLISIIVSAALSFENAEDALAFYGVYHRTPVNQFIHFFGVPGILWSTVIFLVHIPIPYIGTLPIFQKICPTEGLTWGLFISVFYAVFYLTIDPFGGTCYAPFIYASYASAVRLMQSDQQKVSPSEWNGSGRLLKFALVLHIFSWYIQIHVGHRVFEGAQPASLQNLGGALTVAPLFAFYEGLWLMGLNKELQQKTLVLVDQYTLEICTEGKIPMRVCGDLGFETTSTPNIQPIEPLQTKIGREEEDEDPNDYDSEDEEDSWDYDSEEEEDSNDYDSEDEEEEDSNDYDSEDEEDSNDYDDSEDEDFYEYDDEDHDDEKETLPEIDPEVVAEKIDE